MHEFMLCYLHAGLCEHAARYIGDLDSLTYGLTILLARRPRPGLVADRVRDENAEHGAPGI